MSNRSSYAAVGSDDSKFCYLFINMFILGGLVTTRTLTGANGVRIMVWHRFRWWIHLLTLPSPVTANSVCSPPISWTGLSIARASHTTGTLTLAPSTPPSWPRWLWPQPQIWPLPPQDRVQSSGRLIGRNNTELKNTVHNMLNDRTDGTVWYLYLGN